MMCWSNRKKVIFIAKGIDRRLQEMLLFHFSIIPGWNEQDGGLEIRYYKKFVEFPLQLFVRG
jgi:hypothetical protein